MSSDRASLIHSSRSMFSFAWSRACVDLVLLFESALPKRFSVPAGRCSQRPRDGGVAPVDVPQLRQPR